MPHAIEADDPKLVFVRLEEAVVPPPGIIEHLRDRHWIAHPERGLAFFKSGGLLSPLCNADPAIVQRFKPTYPWAEVVFVPSAFRRVRIQDYR